MNGFSWQGRPCLVTGGFGFGGSHLCLRLLEQGARVLVYDRWRPRHSFLDLSGAGPRVDAVLGDIRDTDMLKLTMERFEIDTVFHVAAQPIVPIANLSPAETLSVNVQGTYSVLEALRTGAPGRRLVFASSGAYYGTTTTEAALSEEAPPLVAGNIYAPSKVAGDVAVRTYAKVYGLKAAVCRFMNTYGPGDTNFSRLVPTAARALVQGGDYDFGNRDDGSTRLDFLHIRDMSAAYLKLAEHLDEVAGEAFNFGAGTPVSVRQVAQLASMAYDGKAREPVFSGKPPVKPVIKYLDISKAERLLGWKPALGLIEGMEDTMAWYHEHLRKLIG